MKRLFSVLVVLCIAVVAAMAQAKGPVMAFKVTEIDYGKIDQGSDRVRKFEFKNTGAEPLLIKSARGSCGCTVPDYPKEPIMPGQTNYITVNYDTNRIGAFTKTVTLETNEEAPSRVLTIKGEVKEKAAQQGVPASNPSVLSPKG